MEEFEFPVILFGKDFVDVSSTQNDLTTTTSTALKKGVFSDLLLVDSRAMAVKITGAKTVGGIGPFGGYNIFGNRKIRIELETRGTPDPIAIDQVKTRVLKDFRKWHGWASRGDFEALSERIRNAQTVREIAELMASPGVSGT
jgi:hypothetical protein